VVSLAAVIAAGCSQSSASTTAPTTGSEPAAAQDLVLKIGDAGSGWVTVDKDTGPKSVKDAMKGDPIALKRIEQRSFKSGYQAFYANSAANGIVSAVFTWSSHDDAQRIAEGWAKDVAPKLHIRRLATPPGAPADTFYLWGGKTAQGGRRIPLYLATWVHDSAVVGLYTFGRGVTRQDLLDLVVIENGKLENLF
jgi:hypothetical protein